MGKILEPPDRTSLLTLPVDPVPWELGARVWDWIQEGGDLVLAYLALVSAEKRVRAYWLKVGVPPTPEELADLVFVACGKPMPTFTPARPSVLRIEQEEHAGRLRELLKFLDVKVEVGPVKEMQPVLEGLVEMFGLSSETEPFIINYNPSEVEAYFKAARRFYDLQPWRRFPGTGYIALRVDSEPWIYLNVMGQVGQVPGITVFETWLDLCLFIHNLTGMYEPALLEGKLLKPVEAARGLEGVTLHPLYSLHPRDADYVLRLGWRPLRRDLYPIPLRFTVVREAPYPPRVALPTYTLALEGIARLVTQKAFRGRQLVQVECEISGRHVEMRYPAQGDEDLPMDPGRYRVLSGGKIRGRNVEIRVPGDMTLVDLAVEFEEFLNQKASVRGFGAGDFYLWRSEVGEEPALRVCHLLALEDFWVEIGRTAYPLEVRPA